MGAAAASAALRRAFDAAWTDAGSPPQPVASVFFGIAGLAAFQKTQSPETLIPWLARDENTRISFDHDLRTALAGGLGGAPGMVVIAGTGSSGFGRAADGRTARAGGWGALLDDCGSGYWLGLQALIAVTRSADGRGPPTQLTQGVLQTLGLSGPTEVLSWIRAEPDRRVEIAALAPLIFDAARTEDGEARRLLHWGADELAKIVEAIAKTLFQNQKTDVVFTGGLSQNREYRELLATAIKTRTPALELRRPKYSPVVGALLLAFEAAQISPTVELLKMLDTKAPMGLA